MGDLHSFYASLRWLDWEADALSVTGDRAILFQPPLSQEGQAIDHRRRGQRARQ